MQLLPYTLASHSVSLTTTEALIGLQFDSLQAPRHLRKFSFQLDLIEEVDPAVGLSARNKTLVLKIPDHKCVDMVYQCTVTYREHRGMQPDAFATRSAQQVIRNRAALYDLEVVTFPSKVNNEHTAAEDRVTLTCSVIGPRKLELIWSYRSVERGNFSPVTKGILGNYSFKFQNSLCNKWRHESMLLLQIQYEKWHPGEADSDGVTRRCGLIYCRNKYTNSEQWCSQNCQFKAPFICEKPANALTSTLVKPKPSVPSPCDENGRFGDTCQYKCHCANGVQCDKTTGVCSSGCAQGWFGPACQYDSINNKIHIVYTTPNGTESRCADSHKAMINEVTADISCITGEAMEKLYLYGPGVESLCSLYISRVTQPSRLSPENVFQLDQSKRRPLVITCNADAVGLPAKFTQLASLQILRKCRWKSEIDNIVDYFVYFPLGVRKNIYNPERHNWDIKFSGAAEDFGPSSRALSIEWTIHDPIWADEGIYICNLKAGQCMRAAFENSTNGKKPMPILGEKYIQPNKPVIIKCNADAVGLVSNNLPIESLKLSRSLGVSEEETNYTQNSPDTVFAYYPRSTNNKSEIITLDKKNSEIRFFSNASKVNADNNIHVWTIEWTINNPDDILDAGDYECTVRYTNGDNRFRLEQLRTKAGHPNATALTLLSQDFIERGKPLVVTCNADVVGISPMNVTVESLALSRNIEVNGNKRSEAENETKDTTIMFKQHTNDHKQAIITQDTRNWTFNIISKDLKPDNSTIEWTIHNPDVEDTGNYKCAIKYDDRVADGESRQEQLRAARGNIWNVLLEAKPASQNYEYLEGDEISLFCFAEGPPKLQLHWLLTLENGADFQQSNISQFLVSNISQFQQSNISQFQQSNISQFQESNISQFQEYNILQNASIQYYVSKDFESGSYRHTSVLTLKLGLADNGTVLSCEAQNSQHSERSISIVLRVFDKCVAFQQYCHDMPLNIILRENNKNGQVFPFNIDIEALCQNRHRLWSRCSELLTEAEECNVTKSEAKMVEIQRRIHDFQCSRRGHD
ncbi:calcium binding EGF domain protein, partial [Elysia marginata]